MPPDNQVAPAVRKHPGAWPNPQGGLDMPHDTTTTTAEDEMAELREEWEGLFQRLRAIDPELAVAVDSNCGARAAEEVRPLVEGMRAIATMIDTVPAEQALPAIKATAVGLVEQYDPSY